EHLHHPGGPRGVDTPGITRVARGLGPRRHRGKVDDRVIRQADGVLDRLRVPQLERQPPHGRPLVGREIGGGRNRRRALTRPHGTIYIAAVREQAPDEPAAYEAVGTRHQHPHDCRSTSASTIIRTSWAKLVVGVQPSSRTALLGSAWSASTSAGRTKRGSTFT